MPLLEDAASVQMAYMQVLGVLIVQTQMPQGTQPYYRPYMGRRAISGS